ncbi:ATP-grasp domain-containing protein [Brevibacillus agri]|uniref:ATP-grasp domain-containing protein n=1 Tax=Brevibacillus agri TaxID=51101 RepID=UPI0024BFD4FC|nr:ATP-grasp domain-containing protein [Brevibacillus agri]WHX29697.1 ATP-grasp domain-containing protein [Brevibacillus agri]
MRIERTVLLTGGRAPATLELARLLRAAGQRVIVAESAARHLCAHSRYVQRSYRVPPPRTQPEAYIDELCQIMRKERVDLLIPTCEEIFYVAHGRERLLAHGDVLVEPLAVLRTLHDKWEFGKLARGAGALVPHTVRAESADERDAAIRQATGPVVLKPVYSRFAAHVQIISEPSRARLSALPVPSARQPWLVQRFIAGRQLCSYAVAREGELALYADYETVHTAGQGATIHFAYAAHAGVKDFVTRFVRRHRLSGQIAFDFIESKTGELYVIECNPRLTSGIHLFAGQTAAADAFLAGKSQGGAEGRAEAVVPQAGQTCMLTMAMLTYGLANVKDWRGWTSWVRDLCNARDVLFRAEDPRPFFDQFMMLGDLAWQSLRTKTSMLACSTSDIEWNGETPQ